MEKITGKLNTLAQLNADLLNQDLIGMNVPRWYMYCATDDLVKIDDIEWHARMAKERGWPVEMVEFPNSGHCRHGKGIGEEKYWKFVNEQLKAKL